MTSRSERRVEYVPTRPGTTLGEVVPDAAVSRACGVAVEMRDGSLVGPVFPNPRGSVPAETMQGLLLMTMNGKGYDLDRDGVRMYVYDVRREPNGAMYYVVVDILPLEDEHGNALTHDPASDEATTIAVMVEVADIAKRRTTMDETCQAGREAILGLRDARRNQPRH